MEQKAIALASHVEGFVCATDHTPQPLAPPSPNRLHPQYRTCYQGALSGNRAGSLSNNLFIWFECFLGVGAGASTKSPGTFTSGRPRIHKFSSTSFPLRTNPVSPIRPLPFLLAVKTLILCSDPQDVVPDLRGDFLAWLGDRPWVEPTEDDGADELEPDPLPDPVLGASPSP